MQLQEMQAAADSGRQHRTARRIPLQHMEEIADERLAVLRRVHAIDEQLWRLGAVEAGVDFVAGFTLPLGGGIDGSGRVWARQRCDAVRLGRHDGGRGHGCRGEMRIRVSCPGRDPQGYTVCAVPVEVEMRWGFGGWWLVFLGGGCSGG